MTRFAALFALLCGCAPAPLPRWDRVIAVIGDYLRERRANDRVVVMMGLWDAPVALGTGVGPHGFEPGTNALAATCTEPSRHPLTASNAR